MGERVITPKIIPNLSTTLTDLLGTSPNNVVPTGKEWSITIRATNTTSTDATYDETLNNGSATGSRAKSFPIPAGSPQDVEVGLTLTAGCSLQGRASAANSIDLTITIVEHDAGSA